MEDDPEERRKGELCPRALAETTSGRGQPLMHPSYRVLRTVVLWAQAPARGVYLLCTSPAGDVGPMDRSNEHSRPARFTWSRSAFANSASRVSDVSQQGAWAGAGGANAAREDPHHDSAWSRRPATTSQVVTTLAMDPEKGAQLEVEFVQGCGYRVESIGKEPGQPLMRVGDLLVEAPDEAEVPLSRMVPETPLGAAKLQEDAAPRPLAGLLSSLFSFAPPEEPQAPAGEQPTAGPELPQEEQPLHDETLPSWPEETPEVVTAVTSMTEERPDEAREVIVFESMLPAEKIKDDLDRPQETEPSGLAELEAAKLDDAGASSLQELRLEEYLDPAAKWCSEMGAVCLEEIAENIEDFAADVALKPIERQRVQKWAAQKLQGIAPMQRLREAGTAGVGQSMTGMAGPYRCEIILH
eukprot:g15415.t1